MRMGDSALSMELQFLLMRYIVVMEGQKYIPFASLPDKAIVNNSLTYKAVSKTFSLASMKVLTSFLLILFSERVKYMHHLNLNSLGILQTRLPTDMVVVLYTTMIILMETRALLKHT